MISPESRNAVRCFNVASSPRPARPPASTPAAPFPTPTSRSTAAASHPPASRTPFRPPLKDRRRSRNRRRSARGFLHAGPRFTAISGFQSITRRETRPNLPQPCHHARRAILFAPQNTAPALPTSAGAPQSCAHAFRTASPLRKNLPPRVGQASALRNNPSPVVRQSPSLRNRTPDDAEAFFGSPKSHPTPSNIPHAPQTPVPRAPASFQAPAEVTLPRPTIPVAPQSRGAVGSLTFFASPEPGLLLPNSYF
jgi:hypothetical protein